MISLWKPKTKQAQVMSRLQDDSYKAYPTDMARRNLPRYTIGWLRKCKNH